ncbi:MAG: right-handed parallel beta-helix repeat-containing protein [bacterium]
MLACANRLEAEDALVFMGDSLASAPAPKDFKSTLEYVPPGSSTYFPSGQPNYFYQMWRKSRTAQLYLTTTTWDDSVVAGFQAMNNRHSARIDGVHSFLALAEGCTNQNSKITGINFMCDHTIVDSYVQPWHVPTPFTPYPCDSVLTYEIANGLVSADHFMGGGYYLQTGTPSSGTPFQAALQGFVSSLRDPARGIRDATSTTKLWVVLQAHEAAPPISLRLPTKEEILCQVNLALAQGVKGVVYYVYSTVANPYQSGLLNASRDTTTQYNRVKDINTNYQGTGQNLVTIGNNFLNLTWKEGYSIHLNQNEPINSTYTLYDVTSKIPAGATDAESDTYVEVGVLQNGSTSHYMVVNRRCTGTETREITLTHQGNSNYAYRITDVYSGSTTTCYLGSGITTFPYTLVLGPGQGKLLKLEDIGAWSSTISANTTWSGNYSINANVTVNNNITLTVSPGAIVQFGSAKSLTINGKLVADSNNPNQRITFNGASSTPGFWSGIKIYPGSSTNVSTLRRCNVQYATTGITITYTGNQNYVTVDRCRVSNNASSGITVNGNAFSGAFAHPLISNSHVHSNSSSGISMSNYAKPVVSGNRIEGNTGYGITANTSCLPEVKYNLVTSNSSNGMLFTYSSNAEVHRNTVKTNSSGGVYTMFTSNITAHGVGASKGRNEITNNTGLGIYANGSSPVFGIAPNGYNWIQNNTSYEAQQVGSLNQIRAENCYWGGGAPAPSEISGAVDYSPYTTTVPDSVGWGHDGTYDPSYLKTGNSGTIAELFAPQTPNDPMASAAIFASNGSSSDWTEELRAAIHEGLKTGDWSKATEVITSLHRELQNARIPEVDFSVVTAYANDREVASFIGKMLALVLMEKDLLENKVSDALAKSAAFRQSNAEHQAELLANAGLIHLYRQNDLVAAKNVLSQLQAMAQSGDATAAEHVKFFGMIITDYEGQQSAEDAGLAKVALAVDQASAPPMSTALAQNYPNPFNPETTIRFRLNESQKIRLLLFDLTGKLARTLAEGEFSAGEQIISWDGRDQQGQWVASGVYFYELRTENKVERRKMSLIR